MIFKKKRKKKKFGFWFKIKFIVFTVGLFVVINSAYHLFHKPVEIFRPLNNTLKKSPRYTWMSYKESFKEKSTSTITPTYLAALAQIESGGNPLIPTYWSWKWSVNPLKWYSPASSAAGLYQITEGTFKETKNFCIRDNKSSQDCWHRMFYSRISATDSIEMTAAYLDHHVDDILGRQANSIKAHRKQSLASIIHLCGKGKAKQLVANGWNINSIGKCGNHNPKSYVSRVQRMKKLFDQFAEEERSQAIASSDLLF